MAMIAGNEAILDFEEKALTDLGALTLSGFSDLVITTIVGSAIVANAAEGLSLDIMLDSGEVPDAHGSKFAWPRSAPGLCHMAQEASPAGARPTLPASLIGIDTIDAGKAARAPIVQGGSRPPPGADLPRAPV